MRGSAIQFVPVNAQEAASVYGAQQAPASQIQFQNVSPAEAASIYGAQPQLQSQGLLSEAVPYLNTAAHYASVPAAGLLNLGIQGENFLHQLPYIGKAFPQTNLNANQVFGLPNSPGYNRAINISSGLMGGLLPGPDITEGASLLGKGANFLSSEMAPQGLIGAALDQNNRKQGLEWGAGASLIRPVASAIKYFGSDPLARIADSVQAKNAALESEKELAANNTLSDLISKRSLNNRAYQNSYRAGIQANDHPLPGIEPSSNIPGSQAIRNTTNAELNQLFGENPASHFYQNNPELFAKNYSSEPELSGVTGVEGINPIDKKIIPGFSNKLNASFFPETNFGSAQSPIKPVEAYNNLTANPTVGNALETHRVFNLAKKSRYITPSQAALLNTAQANIKSNLIVPGLKDYDKTFGTNLSDLYSAGDAPYKQEMQWSKISPQFDAATSGNWLPQQRTAQNISKIFSDGIKNGKIEPGTEEYNSGQNLINKIQQNTAKQSENNQILASKMQNLKNRPGPVSFASNIVRSPFYAAGSTLKNISPELQGLALTRVQRNNKR